MSNVWVAGVGMIPFAEPGNSEDRDVMAESDDVSGEILLVSGGMNP